MTLGNWNDLVHNNQEPAANIISDPCQPGQYNIAWTTTARTNWYPKVKNMYFSNFDTQWKSSYSIHVSFAKIAPFISAVFAPNNVTFTTSKDQVSISIVHLLIYNLPVPSTTKLCAGRVVFWFTTSLTSVALLPSVFSFNATSAQNIYWRLNWEIPQLSCTPHD